MKPPMAFPTIVSAKNRILLEKKSRKEEIKFGKNDRDLSFRVLCFWFWVLSSGLHSILPN
jgi:hypothetical protein